MTVGVIIVKLAATVAAPEHLLGINVQHLTQPSPTLENACGGFDTSASRGAGAAYSWCNKALHARVEHTPRHAHSFGIFTFDRWSQTLANAYGLSTTLYDCFETKPLTGAAAAYEVPYVRHNVCLGDTDTLVNVGQRWRNFTSMSTVLRDHSPLSTFVKMDIEGYEWAVLLSMSPSDLAKIVLLDLELHWCEGPANPSKMGGRWASDIVKALSYLRQYFFVAARTHGRGNMSYAATGCVDATKIYTMMSISYVSRDFLFN